MLFNSTKTIQTKLTQLKQRDNGEFKWQVAPRILCRENRHQTLLMIGSFLNHV